MKLILLFFIIFLHINAFGQLTIKDTFDQIVVAMSKSHLLDTILFPNIKNKDSNLYVWNNKNYVKYDLYGNYLKIYGNKKIHFWFPASLNINLIPYYLIIQEITATKTGVHIKFNTFSSHDPHHRFPHTFSGEVTLIFNHDGTFKVDSLAELNVHDAYWAK